MSASKETQGSLLTPREPFQDERTVLILVGLIASGKSTFAQALEEYFPKFRRCNQDDLGNRRQVEELAYKTLSEGHSPCIDRTNFNATQRSYWTRIAHEFPGTSISIIVFDTPYHVCASRLQGRAFHPTIKDPQRGMAILQKFASEFQLPSPEEEYDHIIYLGPADQRPEYARDDISPILGRLKASTRNAGTIVTQRSIQSYFGNARSDSRTNRARGYRSGDGHHGYQGSAPSRGTLHGSARFGARVGGSNGSNWRRPSYGTIRSQSDHPRSAVAVDVPPMEGSKDRDSAEERHNST